MGAVIRTSDLNKIKKVLSSMFIVHNVDKYITSWTNKGCRHMVSEKNSLELIELSNINKVSLVQKS
jgi:hypothetical protein